MPSKDRWLRRLLAHAASPSDPATALLAVMVVISLAASPLPERSWAALPPLALGLLLFLGLAKLPFSLGALQWIGRGLAAIALPICLITPLSMTPRVLPDWASPLLASVHLQQTFNANVIAGALVLLLPFCVVQAKHFHTGHRAITWMGRGMWTLGTGLSLLLVWGTQSRGAYVAVVMAVFALALVSRPRTARWIVPVAAIGALLAGAILSWAPMFETLLHSPASHGLDVRQEIWSLALMAIRDRPVTGIGLGVFGTVLTTLYPLGVGGHAAVSHAHNLYLQVALDLGLPGLIAYLSVLILSCLMAWRSHRMLASLGKEPSWLAAACLAALVGMATHGLIDGAVWGNMAAPLPWVVMGYAAGLYRWAVSTVEQADD